MPEINLRIKVIRKELKISQQQLANLIDLSQGAINLIEHGQRNVTENHINKLIEIGVNEDFIRNGNYPILSKDIEEATAQKIVNQITDDKLIKNIILEFWNLNENEKRIFLKYLSISEEKRYPYKYE